MLSTLVLVPTEYELECLTPQFHQKLRSRGGAAHVCGFGPILSGISAMRMVTQFSPERVILVGIAGSFDPKFSLASCVEFDEVVCYGIGVGTGRGFKSASELGWYQWSSKDGNISDRITLWRHDPNISPMQLLTCCSASSNQEEVLERLSRFPDAKAEDMEGFAVAAACQIAGVPLRILRGISNVVGDRDKRNWQIRDAMASVESTVSTMIG